MIAFFFECNGYCAGKIFGKMDISREYLPAILLDIARIPTRFPGTARGKTIRCRIGYRVISLLPMHRKHWSRDMYPLFYIALFSTVRLSELSLPKINWELRLWTLPPVLVNQET
jgi:hypothetical protein